MPPTPQLKLIKTLWGIEDPLSPSLLDSIRKEGYHGIEVIRLAWQLDEANLVESLNHAGLQVVCQIHTTGGFLQEENGGEYCYCGEYDVEQHKADFTQQLHECAAFLAKVNAGGFVNVHAGVDAWETEQVLDFLKHCLQEIEEQPFPVTFETHRQRVFGNPFQTRHLLRLYGTTYLKDLKLNADLSHWYCACERVFDAKTQKRDAWWPELVEMVGRHCHYIHARLGWAQGPQMADPAANECELERDLQVDVWRQLLKTMKNRNNNCYLSPEYGPPPYLPVIPNTKEPVASLTAAVEYTKKILIDIFSE